MFRVPKALARCRPFASRSLWKENLRCTSFRCVSVWSPFDPEERSGMQIPTESQSPKKISMSVKRWRDVKSPSADLEMVKIAAELFWGLRSTAVDCSRPVPFPCRFSPGRSHCAARGKCGCCSPWACRGLREGCTHDRYAMCMLYSIHSCL